jgi:hypothetical protein
MKALFVVTSCLVPAIGVFSPDERLKQTLETIDSIRKKAPDSFIVLSDVSVERLTEKYDELISKVDLFLNLAGVDFLLHLTKNGMKSQGECAMMHVVLDYLQKNTEVLEGIDRIFKITGRIQLDDDFNLDEYTGLNGKYVFKKRVPTWMSEHIYGAIHVGATHVFDTRLWSMCTTLVQTHMDVLQNVFPLLGPIDLEHAYFATVDKELVVEFDRVHCKGQVASTGEWKFD